MKEGIHVFIGKFELSVPLNKEGAEYASKWVKDIANHILAKEGIK